jgi:superfamily II DNA or RNA helicase
MSARSSEIEMGAPAIQTAAADDPWAFQTDLVHQIEAALGNHASVLLQLPTGGGKTHVAAAVIRRWNARKKRVWFVCHTRELIQQTCGKLNALRVSHGVVSPEYLPAYERRVQVCSVDTLRSRIGKLGDLLQDPDLIVWDECQHVAAPSWAAIKERYAKARHLGLTATPERLDGTGLGQWFDHMICGPTTRDLIARGRLSRYRLFAPTIPDLRGVKTLAGDYAAADLDERMGGPVLVGDVVEHYRKLAPGARAIVFAVSVKHSQAVVERFRGAGIPAAHVDGRTSKDDRDAAVARLASGEIRILSNVRVFTEGFDLPAIDAVIVLRPTKSRALFLQMIGRGLRGAEGKAATIVLDHAGVVYEHGLPDDAYEWTLDGQADRGGRRNKPLGSRLRRCPECNAVHERAAECVECGHVYAPGERTIDEVYGELREIWGQIPDGYVNMSDFEKMVGISDRSSYGLIKRGLPAVKCSGITMIDVSEGVKWFYSYAEDSQRLAGLRKRPGDHIDYLTSFELAQRLGIPATTTAQWVRRGLPIGANGYIHFDKAKQWIAENTRFSTHLECEGLEKISDFAKRIRRTVSAVYQYAKSGMPTLDNSWVQVEEALDWCRERGLGHTPDLLSITAFAEHIGCCQQTVTKWMGVGLPFKGNKRIPLDEALAWVYSDPEARRLVPPRGSAAGGYEKQYAFAKRVGSPASTVAHWVSKGLPVADNGWVHVERGLAWYKDYKSKQRK